MRKIKRTNELLKGVRKVLESQKTPVRQYNVDREVYSENFLKQCGMMTFDHRWEGGDKKV